MSDTVIRAALPVHDRRPPRCVRDVDGLVMRVIVVHVNLRVDADVQSRLARHGNPSVIASASSTRTISATVRVPALAFKRLLSMDRI